MPSIYSVKEKYENWLLSLPGVVGVGVMDGEIVVYVTSQRYASLLPTSLEGYPVRPVVVGETRIF